MFSNKLTLLSKVNVTSDEVVLFAMVTTCEVSIELLNFILVSAEPGALSTSYTSKNKSYEFVECVFSNFNVTVFNVPETGVVSCCHAEVQSEEQAASSLPSPSELFDAVPLSLVTVMVKSCTLFGTTASIV